MRTTGSSPRAGPPCRGRPDTRYASVHPRARGAAATAVAIQSPNSGSSPRARGRPSLVPAQVTTLRSIPACAGPPDGSENRGRGPGSQNCRRMRRPPEYLGSAVRFPARSLSLAVPSPSPGKQGFPPRRRRRGEGGGGGGGTGSQDGRNAQARPARPRDPAARERPRLTGARTNVGDQRPGVFPFTEGPFVSRLGRPSWRARGRRPRHRFGSARPRSGSRPDPRVQPHRTAPVRAARLAPADRSRGRERDEGPSLPMVVAPRRRAVDATRRRQRRAARTTGGGALRVRVLAFQPRGGGGGEPRPTPAWRRRPSVASRDPPRPDPDVYGSGSPSTNVDTLGGPPGAMLPELALLHHPPADIGRPAAGRLGRRVSLEVGPAHERRLAGQRHAPDVVVRRDHASGRRRQRLLTHAPRVG